MAGVWEAQDEVLGRAVAVKVLASHLSEDDRARRRFEREARAAAGLSSHPHVVTIYDVGEHDGRAFMVMELMSGGTVGERLKAGRAIADETALRWLREAAGALDAAHAAGVVHRDIKPGNLLLDDHDRLAIADFGIARIAMDDQLTATGQVLGTAAYIAPEQADGRGLHPGLGPLRAGRRRVRAADRRQAVRGRALRRPGARPRRGRAAARQRARPLAAARRGRGARAGHGQGPRRALGQRGRDGRRARPRDGRRRGRPPSRRGRSPSLRRRRRRAGTAARPAARRARRARGDRGGRVRAALRWRQRPF